MTPEELRRRRENDSMQLRKRRNLDHTQHDSIETDTRLSEVCLFHSIQSLIILTGCY
jgi:hypothetical protein